MQLPPGSSVWNFPARIVECVAISFSRNQEYTMGKWIIEVQDQVHQGLGGWSTGPGRGSLSSPPAGSHCWCSWACLQQTSNLTQSSILGNWRNKPTRTCCKLRIHTIWPTSSSFPYASLRCFEGLCDNSVRPGRYFHLFTSWFLAVWLNSLHQISGC